MIPYGLIEVWLAELIGVEFIPFPTSNGQMAMIGEDVFRDIQRKLNGQAYSTSYAGTYVLAHGYYKNYTLVDAVTSGEAKEDDSYYRFSEESTSRGDHEGEVSAIFGLGAVETPAVEAPAVEAPAVEAPAVEEPAINDMLDIDMSPEQLEALKLMRRVSDVEPFYVMTRNGVLFIDNSNNHPAEVLVAIEDIPSEMCHDKVIIMDNTGNGDVATSPYSPKFMTHLITGDACLDTTTVCGNEFGYAFYPNPKVYVGGINYAMYPKADKKRWYPTQGFTSPSRIANYIRAFTHGVVDPRLDVNGDIDTSIVVQSVDMAINELHNCDASNSAEINGGIVASMYSSVDNEKLSNIATFLGKKNAVITAFEAPEGFYLFDGWKTDVKSTDETLYINVVNNEGGEVSYLGDSVQGSGVSLRRTFKLDATVTINGKVIASKKSDVYTVYSKIDEQNISNAIKIISNIYDSGDLNPVSYDDELRNITRNIGGSYGMLANDKFSYGLNEGHAKLAKGVAERLGNSVAYCRFEHIDKFDSLGNVMKIVNAGGSDFTRKGANRTIYLGKEYEYYGLRKGGTNLDYNMVIKDHVTNTIAAYVDTNKSCIYMMLKGSPEQMNADFVCGIIDKSLARKSYFELVEDDKAFYSDIEMNTLSGYEKIYLDDVEEIIKKNNDDRKNLMSEYSSKMDAINNLASKIAKINITIAGFDSDKLLESRKAQAESDLGKIRELDKVSSVFVNEGDKTVNIYTHNIYVKVSDKYYDIGTFRIVIRIGDREYSQSNTVRLFNTKNLVNAFNDSMNAPHVFPDGHMCHGNLTPGITRSYMERDLFGVVYQLLVFLQSVNLDDDAGRHINREKWEEVSEEVALAAPGNDALIYGVDDGISHGDVASSLGLEHV